MRNFLGINCQRTLKITKLLYICGVVPDVPEFLKHAGLVFKL